MKTVQLVGYPNEKPDIRRVSDAEAEKLVSTSRFKYVPKSVWKDLVRNVKAQESIVELVQKPKPVKKGKRNERKSKFSEKKLDQK